MEVYLKEPEIDNNLVENAIRPTALGKKNWLFSVMPMPANAEHHLLNHRKLPASYGIEPYTYLHDVLARLPFMTNRLIGNVVGRCQPRCVSQSSGMYRKLI